MPKGWTCATIPEMIPSEGIFVDGDWIESKDQDPNGGVRLIQLADIGDGDFKNKSSRFLTLKRANELKCTFLQQNDILVARMPDPIGRACLFPLINKNSFVTAVDVAIIRISEKSIMPKYLMFSINSLYIRREIESLQSGTTRKRISRSNLAIIKFPLPPLPEQQRIVAKIEELFSSLNKGIESLKTAQQQLKVYRQAVLKWAFEGKLMNSTLRQAQGTVSPVAEHKSVAEPVEATDKEGVLPKGDALSLPKGWKWIKLGEVVNEFVRGPFGGSLKKECFVPNGYKVYEQKNAIYQSTELGKYFINENKFKELIRFKVKPNDFIVSCSGTIGKLFMIPEKAPKGIINQALLIIRINRNLLLDKFFMYLFTSSFFQRLIINDAKGTAMLNLAGVKDMKLVPVLLPPLSEQQAIVAEIESRLSICDKIEESIEQSLKQSESLRQSILKKAFEGKLVPQDPNDEPASKLLECIKAQKEKTANKKRSKI